MSEPGAATRLLIGAFGWEECSHCTDRPALQYDCHKCDGSGRVYSEWAKEEKA